MTFERKQLQGLYRYCYSLTRDANSAADLLQTSLVKWIDSGKFSKHQPAYVRKIIRNQFIDDCRRNKKVEFETIDAHATALVDESSLEDMKINSELVEIIFAKLNAAEGEIIYLWAVEGYTAREISEELGQPRGTVLSRLHRVKQKITALIEAGEELERAKS